MSLSKREKAFIFLIAVFSALVVILLLNQRSYQKDSDRLKQTTMEAQKEISNLASEKKQSAFEAERIRNQLEADLSKKLR